MRSGKESRAAYWHVLYKQFHKNFLGKLGLYCVLIFCFFGIYAPFFASSKPFVVEFDGKWYFPFFRYLFFPGFYTKKLDIFFNLLMFSLPAFFVTIGLFKRHEKALKVFLTWIIGAQIGLFFYFSFFHVADPASDPQLAKKRHEAVQERMVAKRSDEFHFFPQREDWYFDLRFMNDYAKLNAVMRYVQRKHHHQVIEKYAAKYLSKYGALPTLWQMDEERSISQIVALEKSLEAQEAKALNAFQTLSLYLEACQSLNALQGNRHCYDLSNAPIVERKELIEAQKQVWAFYETKDKLNFYKQRKKWLEDSAKKIGFLWMPIVPFHWEDDAGGDQRLNQVLPWWELTRSNRKELIAALIFGIRISLVVGFLAVALAFAIGVPIGAFAGFYGGTFDIVVSRLLEVWESMPTFFMLLLVIAISQSKSIFIVISVIGLFAWPVFSRYTRSEVFKQRNLAYVEASTALGFSDSFIIFKEILPNAIPPLLTLLPFAIMGAITSEAGLSFLGLGEDGSCSWGILMDEGRKGFPSEAYLLWPPAILLTILLVSIALVGDALRDALDPKLKR
ncbi:putative oligopeptide transport system permease protein, oppC [Chlamydiales bacterium STE3]|nr:putative oligopeptide transport system permease protein, oppC [Chlamydiales bacterium STE3]